MLRALNPFRAFRSVCERGVILRSDEPWPKRVLKRWWVRRTRGLAVEFRGSGQELRIGRSRLLEGKALIHGSGNRVRIGDGCHFTTTWLDVHAWDSELIIGDGTRIFGHAELGTTLVLVRGKGRRVAIGRGGLLSYAVEIRNCDGHSIREVSSGRLLNAPRDITLGERVWVGAGATVLKGATIGDGSIIGAGSVVTGAIEAGVVAVGRPARTKRGDVSWSLEEPRG